MPTRSQFTLRFVVFVCLCFRFGDSARAQSLGDSAVTYLQSTLGTRVGGGSSSHMATEALRIAGAEFVPDDLGSDFPATGDKVWGTLVTVITFTNNNWTDSNPGNACLPGDVIQFGSATLATANYPTHFTAVVANVNGGGRPNSIYQQNLGGDRVVQQSSIDTTTLTNGWLRIYRPVTRIDRFNEWKFTVVNNDTSDQTYQILFGVDIDTEDTLTSSDTSGSYRVYAVTTDGTVPNLFLFSSQVSFFVQTAKGNQISNSPGGLVIGQLDQ